MSLPTVTTFFIYLVAMMVIAAYAYRNTRDLSDYLLGGRRLTPMATALSAGASDMSGWLLLGLPGAVYISGLQEAWIVVGLVTGAYLNWQFVARPLRVATARHGSLTLPDYFEQRFQDDSKALRLISAMIILLFFTFYAASGLVAGAKLFTSTFDLSYHLALLIGGLVIVGYTAIGGFLAVSWTDVVQGLLMLLALLVVPLVMVVEMDGLGQALDQLRQMNTAYLNIWTDVSAITLVSLLAWGLGYFGQPHILARFMAIDAAESVPRARWIGMSWMLATTCAAVAVGLFGIVYLQQSPLEKEDAEKIFILLTQLIFNPWIAGVLLAAILAAIMSTIDSQLLVSSSSLAEDFYKSWVKPHASPQEMVVVGRVTVLIIAAVAFTIAFDPESQVLGLVSYAWAGLGASFGPVVLFSLYWPAMTRLGAITGMLAAATTVVAWKQLEGGIFDIYELLPAFILGCIGIVTVSLLGNYFSSSSFDRSNQ